MRYLRLILFNITALAFIIIFCGGLLLVTFTNTNPRTQKETNLYEEKKLLEILSPYSFTNSIIKESITLPASTNAGIEEGSKAYLGKQNQEIIAILLPITVAEGYGGKIKMLVGISSKREILGTKILSHHETAGLGDKIETDKSNWIKSFRGRSIKNTNPNEWDVKKDGGDFDQLTGATITSRSIIFATKRLLNYVENNYETLFNSQ